MPSSGRQRTRAIELAERIFLSTAGRLWVANPRASFDRVVVCDRASSDTTRASESRQSNCFDLANRGFAPIFTRITGEKFRNSALATKLMRDANTASVTLDNTLVISL